MSEYVVRFRMKTAGGAWWYLGAFYIGTTDRRNAIRYKSRADAVAEFGKNFASPDAFDWRAQVVPA